MVNYWICLFAWAVGVVSIFTCIVELQPPIEALGYVALSFIYGFIGCKLLWGKN